MAAQRPQGDRTAGRPLVIGAHGGVVGGEGGEDHVQVVLLPNPGLVTEAGGQIDR